MLNITIVCYYIVINGGDFMSMETIIASKLHEQLQQAEATSGNRLILKRVQTKDNILGIIALLLTIPTLSISLWLFVAYALIKELTCKTYLVKNIATGEQFRVDKNEFKQYKREFKMKEKDVRKISDLK
jgi:hypothetical protein